MFDDCITEFVLTDVYGCCFSSGNEGLFRGTIFPKKPTFSLLEKEDLREVIEEGKRTATCESEFIAHLAKYGVSVTRSKTEYSYLHPEKKKAIRGLKLGQNYTKSEVLNAIEKHGNRTNGNTAYDVAGNERTGQTTYQNRFAQIRRLLAFNI